MIHVDYVWRQFYDETVLGGKMAWYVVFLFILFSMLMGYRIRVKMSTWLDMQWYLLSLTSVFGPLARFFAVVWLSSLLSFRPMFKVPGPILFLIVYVVSDFWSYVAHWISHRVDCLWQFHKVHHYPRQLNIFAGFRNHPFDTLIASKIEVIGTTLMVSWFMVARDGGYTYIFTEHPILFLLFIFLPSIFSRLNHSGLPIFFGSFFGRMFISPADHFVHHTMDRCNQNYGSTFVFWDRMFGTYHTYQSEGEFKKEIRQLGIHGMRDDEYRSVLGAFFVPIIDFFRVVFHAAR